ncbi:MAG: hypothetical protein KatS3mg115_0171 [Candidatus Poribacteria bacterium]|nr:MAG: hypothetical protein KatS3mg115_0171 [Candidatus Poribacteria bacterium]
MNAGCGTNVRGQKDQGYAIVTVTLPLGDITSEQLRALAAVCRKYIRDTIRFTVNQNIVLRWVPQGELVRLYQDPPSPGAGRARRRRPLRRGGLPGDRLLQVGDRRLAGPWPPSFGRSWTDRNTTTCAT